jgi:hypothetical protein
MSWIFSTRRKEKGKHKVVQPQPPIREECGVESSTREAADTVSTYFFNILREPMEGI